MAEHSYHVLMIMLRIEEIHANRKDTLMISLII